MPIRITGMNSGLDTESIISELVKAQKTKVDSVKKKQTTLQWKQEAWKELNSKIYKLFQNTIGNMRLATDYSKKITDVSNSSIAKVISSDSAMDATQTLKVVKLAKTGYMTGDEVDVEGSVTKDSKLSDIGIKAGSTVTITTGGKSTDIEITEDMTIDAFTNKLREAGVEANFDEKNKRFHIAAKKSGDANDFVITAANTDGTDALKKLGILSYDEKTIKEYEKYKNMSEDEKKAAIAKDVSSRLNEYISQREELLKEQKKQQDSLAEKKAAFSTEYGEDIETVDKDDLKQKIDDLKTKIEDAGESATEADKEELAKLQGKMSAVEQYESQQKELDEVTKNIADVESYLDLSDSANITAGSKLQTEVEAAWESKIKTATDIVNVGIDNLKLQQSKVGKVDGQDAHITLNGVDYYGENNTFEVNGLTITALQESSEEITMTTRRDTDGVYNMIKGFLKEYNALMNEMDKLYNAEATKDYEPLTDEEKKELSDSDVEKWEAKIKDSILRRDSNLSTISSAMKNVMLQGAVVNGKQMYLSNFGIETLGYFSAAENERNAYHINGDEDDAAVSSKDNDLKAAIAADPDTVIAFFSQLSQNLYTELDKQSRSVDGVRSFGSFYDDKRMQDDYNDYKEKIKKQESKLTAMEDKWYKKFSAMETAMAKMQSNQSAVSSLLGGM
ncbi:hypothetical protein D3Z45_17500 [Lachnospiraceae bacterium]|nr:hypothetical protein [Lachnospiraceae bacterium]